MFRKNTKQLTIIIVTYNSEHIIGKCLEGLVHDAFDIIVVDNASTDKTLEVVSKFPNVKIVNPQKNIGYGRAANLGFKNSKTPYALLLNPDLKATPYQIQELLDSAKQHKNAVAFAPIVTKKTVYDKTKPFEKVQWICGAAMLFNMKLLKKVGYFDENFFLFYEETDLCKRIIKEGYDIIRFNNQFMEHLECASSANTKPKRYARYWHTGWSHFYFTKKYETEEVFIKTVNETVEKYAKEINSAGSEAEKLMQYTALLVGGTAFLTGLKAFDDNGNPTVKP